MARYTAVWKGRADHGNAVGAWVATSFEKARATLAAELRRNLALWGRDERYRYEVALRHLENAAEGELTATLPRHTLAIREATAPRTT